MQPATQVSLSPQCNDIRHLRANQEFCGVIGWFGLRFPKPLDQPLLLACECSLYTASVPQSSHPIGGHKDRWHDRAQERLARYQPGINPDSDPIANGLLRFRSPAHAKFRARCQGYADMVFMAQRDMDRRVDSSTTDRER